MSVYDEGSASPSGHKVLSSNQLLQFCVVTTKMLTSVINAILFFFFCEKLGT